jgi:diguanylate cyclase (GGDEF)-like protein
LALGLLLLGLSFSGVLAGLAQGVIESPLGLAFCALLAFLPGLAYAWILKREKPAPLLRSPAAPFVLLGLAHLAVQLSGGLKSPFFISYALLLFATSPFSSLGSAASLAALACAIEIPAYLKFQEPPSLLWGLLSPWLGLLLSRLLALRAAPAPAKQIQGDGQVRAQAPIQELPEIDPQAFLKRGASQLLDLAFHAHPHWNALLLLWFDGKRLTADQGRMRRGQLKLDFSVGPGEGVLGLALRDQKVVEAPELSSSNAQVLPYYDGPGAAAALVALPFFDEGSLLGMLVADKAEAGPWSDDEKASLEYLGLQMVQQSQQAGFFGRVQERGRQLSLLYHVSKELSSDLDGAKLLKRIPSLLSSLLSFDSYYVALRDAQTGHFVLAAQEGYREDYSKAYDLDENTVLGGWVLTSGEPVAFNADRAEAAVPAFLSDGLALEASSFLLVPLMLSGKVTGLLKLDRREGLAFSEADREAALIFASQAAVTLEHARLYGLNQRMATTDGLTGLYNHRYFQERLALELEKAQRNQKPLTLALTDIDFFKKFNDEFGHQEGDQVLMKTARMLKESVRLEQDVVCRYGGEEFVVIMPECDLVEAREVSERVRLNCAERLKGGHGSTQRAITLSIGLCSFPAGAKTPKELIHLADEALYKAKQDGRNRVCSFKDLTL